MKWTCSASLLALLLATSASSQPFQQYRQAHLLADNVNYLVGLLGRRAFERLRVELKKDASAHLLDAIAATGHPGVKELLLDILRDPQTPSPRQRRFLRERAIAGLRRFSDEPGVALAVANLLSRENASRFVKEAAVEFLLRAARPETAASLIAFDRSLHGRNTRLADLTGRALAAVGGDRAMDYLEEKLSDTSRAYLPWYGYIAVEAARYRRVRLLEVLLRAARLTLSRRTVVPNVFRALGLMGDRRAVPLLAEVVGRKDFRIRYWSAISLGLLGDTAALPALRRALDKVVDCPASRRWVNRAAIAFALARLGDESGRKLLAEQASRGQIREKMLALLFLLRLAEQGPPAVSLAGRMVDLIRPYAAIDGCPRFPWEQIFSALSRVRHPRIIELLLEMADWKKAGAAPWHARQVLAEISRERLGPVLCRLMGQGSWPVRLARARQLESLGADALGCYHRLYRQGDLPARLLAARRAGMFFPGRAAGLLRRARRDPAWQVVEEARRLASWLSGSEPFPTRAPALGEVDQGELLGYRPAWRDYGQLQSRVVKERFFTEAPVRRLLADQRGAIWAATGQGLMSYDGMQWQLASPPDACGQQVFDLVEFGGTVWAASDGGLWRLERGRPQCALRGQAVVRLATAGQQLFVGTRDGVYRFVGGRLQPLAETPGAGPVRALAVAPWGELWVYRKAENQAGRLLGFQNGRWSDHDELLLHFWSSGGAVTGLGTGRLAVNGLASLPAHRALAVASDWGPIIVKPRQSRLLGTGSNGWPWLPAWAVAESGADTLWLGYPGQLVELRRNQARLLRFDLQPAGEAMAPYRTPPADLLVTGSGELWLAGRRPAVRPGNTMATVLRRPRADSKRLAMPPETVVTSIAGGGIRLDNPDAALRLPNQARRFQGGKTVRIPGVVVSVAAVAKDPWDFSRVDYRFKVDEGDWSAWSRKNTLVTQRLLDEGVHRVLVQSRDEQGNIDPSPAEVRFTVVTRTPTIVRIEDGRFQRIFPSQLLRYQKKGLGRVLLRNTSSEPVKVDLQMKVEDMFEKPASSSVTLPPKSQRWVVAPAPLSGRLLRRLTAGTVQLVVEARYRWQEAERTTRRSFPLHLLEANAMSWADPRALAAFVNPHDPLVELLGGRVNQALSNEQPVLARRSHPLHRLALVLYAFRAVEGLGVRYKSDPSRPFASQSRQELDTVQFPTQTLERRAGDCDDLTVLLASLLENLDVATALVTVEGHVFLIFDTGVRPANRLGLPLRAGWLEERAGTLWAGLETTLLGRRRSFLAVLQQAAGHRRQRRVFELRTCWNEYPPVVLESDRQPELGDLRLAGAGQELERLRQKLAGRVARAASGLQGSAALLAQARALLQAGSFGKAAESFRRLLQKDESFPARYGLAASLAGQGQLAEAIVEFRRAERTAPDDQQRFQALLALAQCYRTDGNLVRARSFLERALALNPAAGYDSRYRPLVKYLTTASAGKAAAIDQAPPFFQMMIEQPVD